MRFDTEALYVRLDRARRDKRISWRELARQAGTSPSTATRIAQGRNPDADNLSRLLAWLGDTDIRTYMTDLPEGSPDA